MGFNMKGKRKYACADCKRTAMLHWVELSRRNKPRCQGCGGTFFEPYSDGATEMEINAGTARAIKDSEPPMDPRANVKMRGESEVPKARP